MCDLIDFNSPDVKGLLEAGKLASPLIPVPKTSEVKDDAEANPLVAEKRENVDSNPFDRVLHETTEYISKKGDPFEVMLQRALKFKGKQNTDRRAQAVDFTDDFTPRRKKRYLKTMNKTLNALDDSSLGPELTCKKLVMEFKEESVSQNARSIDSTCNNNVMENAAILKKNLKVLVTQDPVSLESSILNQSGMNDTLLDVVLKGEEDDELSPFLRNDTVFKELMLPVCTNIKSTDLRRTLSQGDRRSPTKVSVKRRLQSATDGLQRTALQSDTSSVSTLNRGFRDSKQSEQSVFSSVSSISFITKSNSASVSSLTSLTDTMNDAFLNSGSLKINQERTSMTEGSLEVQPRQYDLSDLTERLNKLKCAINGTNSISSITDDSSSPKEDDKKQITNDKLIDVDAFILQENSSKEHNKNSISTNSSDSIFSDSNKFDRSILKEAKALARTFEESALKTDSGSNADDDFISNNTMWMSELLPAFEDAPVVDNLIELPVSPEGNFKSITKDERKHVSSMNNAKESSLQELMSQFTNPSTAKQTIVTSLLSDLKKLVKADNNTEINKLLNNLENALGTNCQNNTELLVTCLNISNELQSPRKSNTESSEKIGTDESGKVSSEGEICNEGKSTLSDVTRKSENVSPAARAAAVVTDDESAEISPCKDTSDSPDDAYPRKVASSCSISCSDEDNQLDEKLAVELLTNLRKLLRGQAEDAATMQLLKNIGKALNIASNTWKVENEQQTDCSRKQIQQTIPVKAVGADRVGHLASTTRRRSFDLRSKTSEKKGRRSVPVMDSPTKNIQSTQHRYKGTSEVENHKKRFSSDSEFLNLANKVAIPEASKKKADLAGYDVKKEKPIAIGDVKSKLKKKSSVINRKGPMKAVHPVSNAQKGASLGKQAIPSFDIITPPKSDKVAASNSKIISSTPNSLDSNYYIPKKSAKSKPMASSTPDYQNSTPSSGQLQFATKTRNLSCDISPVATYANKNDNDERKDSPKRQSKLPTPKKSTTPKRQETDAFRVSRYSTPPRHNSSLNMNKHALPESPQRLNRSLTVYGQRYSPASQRKSGEKMQESPLKENNRVIAKVKPLKLICKLKRHSNLDFTEKENNCA